MQVRRINILLVEDNDDDSLLIEESFADDEHMNVLYVVRDGEEALRYLRREGEYENAPQPDLVLLDINLPKKNGFEVLEEIKQDPLLQFIPIVMLTTSQREEDVARSYSGGACSFITKPVDYDHFKQVLKSFSPYWANVASLPPRD